MLTELSLEALLDREFVGRHRAERVQITVDREDIRLHQPCCHNASAYDLRGYMDDTLPSCCYASP